MRLRKIYTLFFVIYNLDAGVARDVGKGGLHLCESACVFEKDNVTLVFDELALFEDAIHLGPAASTTIEVNTPLRKLLLERRTSLPSIVVGYLAGHMVEDVGLRDAIGGVGTEPGHDAAAVAEEVAVEGGESTAREGEFGGAVVREKGVGVLKECDEDEPLIDPEIRDEIKAEDSCKSVLIDTVADGGEPEDDAKVGDEDLHVVVGREHNRARREVICALWVSPLSRSVEHNVRRPSSQ